MPITGANDDFSKLDATKHMFAWLAEDPYPALRKAMEKILEEQAAGSFIWVYRVVSDPDWLTGGKRDPEDPEKIIVTRSGVAFCFELEVELHGQFHQLAGVFTLAAIGLDDPLNRRERLWMDLEGDLKTFGADGQLQERIYFND